MPEINKDEIDRLREEMHDCIDKYGLSDKRTIEKSQLLDVALNNFGIDITS